MDASCLGASETFGKESLVLELIGGVPYYVIVDGFANDYDESGTYTYTLETLAYQPAGKVTVAPMVVEEVLLPRSDRNMLQCMLRASM